MDKRVILSLSLLVLIGLIGLVSADTITCSDSDNGQNFNQKGSLNIGLGAGTIYENPGDSTNSIQVLSPSNVIIPTLACNQDGSSYDSLTINATTGTEYPLSFMIDTKVKITKINFFAVGDPRNNIETTSILTGVGCKSDIFTDVCTNSTTLSEFYCKSNSATIAHSDILIKLDTIFGTTNYTCQYGCENGACKAAPQCIEDWQCGSWSSCNTNGRKTRTCTDQNHCGTTSTREESQVCCTSNWQCSEWSECWEDNTQTRGCQDTSGCNNPNDKGPETSQPCTYIAPNLKIHNQEAIVQSSGDMKTIKTNDVSATTNLNLIENSGKIYVKTDVGNVEVKISPSDAKSIAKGMTVVKAIQLKEDNNKILYVILGEKEARLFWLIPVTANVEQGIDAQTGESIYMKKSWWAFLAAGI